LAVITRRWLARPFGFAHVAVQTLATGHGRSGGTQDLAPLANDPETAQLLALAGGFVEPAPGDFRRVAPAHVWIEMATSLILLVLIDLAIAWFTTRALWALVLVAPVAGLFWLSHRPHGWFMSGAVLAIRRGWFAKKQVLVPVRNIQSLQLERGPLQRKLGLASLAIDTAGGSMLGLRIANLPQETARRLLHDLRQFA
jgi:putative membrane protein